MSELTKTPFGLVEGSILLRVDAAECQLRFAADEPFFAGHFPEHPLVPGVILVEALVRLAQKWSKQSTDMRELNEAKFSAEVRPNDLVRCHLQKSANGFSGEMRVNDRVVLKAKFTL